MAFRAAVAAALVAGAAAQCTGPPRWTPSYAMRASLYTYCFGSCPLSYLALPNVSAIGRFAGLVGVDHYFTKQGMPCVDGIPQEFAHQDAFATATKATFPSSRVLEYRILDAVPYAEVVHALEVAHPEYFVRWHHAPYANGSICEMPPEQATAGFNCSWPIRAAAYDWTQPAVRDWFIDNIIKPTLVVADGSWTDGDGPDNGAWACSGSYDRAGLIPPYPALDVNETAAFTAGAALVLAEAQQWLIANGGYEYNCIDFVQSPAALPNSTDAPATCATKLAALDHLPPKGHHVNKSSIVLYGSRTASAGYDEAHAAQAVAVFMLVRDDWWWFGLPATDSFSPSAAAAFLSVDFGPPLANMTRDGFVFSRRYTGGTVSLDCSSYEASFAAG